MIAIDIEMPKSCYECRFKVGVYCNLYSCLFDESHCNWAWAKESFKDKRQDICPLKEIMKGEE